MVKVEKYTCGKCDRSYRLRNSLNKHKKHFHGSTEIYECSDCGSEYSYKSSLRSHITSKHLSPAMAVEDVNQIFECYTCGKKYSGKRSLQRHILSKHLKSNCEKHNFECLECSRNFSSKNNLRRHIFKKHINNVPTKKSNFTCVLCHETFPSEFDIVVHFQKIHNIQIVPENHSFQSREEFIVWKDNVENQQYCSYRIICQRRNKSENQITSVYRCNRSGFYTPPVSRKRKLQMRGSKKINGFCPSKIVYIAGDNFHEVVFTNVHIGHYNDYQQMAHMKYSLEVKNAVAKKLACGLPVKKILEDLVPPLTAPKPKDCLRKIDLLNEKDVYNIAKSYGISVKNCDRHHQKNIIGIESWVKNNEESVCFYKGQGEIDESRFKLQYDDFVLVIMKPDQIKKFVQFSSDIIIIDSTHGTPNVGKFFLHTILVEDEYGEAYPACFLITNRNDTLVFDVMFSCICKKFGPISTKVLMTNMQMSCWNSWICTMGIYPTYHLFCSWFVIRAWQRNYAKVKFANKREAIKQNLMKLLYEENVAKFHDLLAEFVSEKDEDTRTFMQYFKDKYESNYDKWAYCYRLQAGVNTNLSLKYFHKVFKYHYNSGMTIEQVQDTLNHLDKYLWKVICSGVRADVMSGKLSKKLEILRQEHVNAVSFLDTCEITEIESGKTWNIILLNEDVNEEEKPRSYLLQKIKDDCCDCPMLCEDCQFCYHQFNCSCLQNTTKSIMCKHIHLLCLKELQEIVPIYCTNMAEVDTIYLDAEKSFSDGADSTAVTTFLETTVTKETDNHLQCSKLSDDQLEKISDDQKKQLVLKFIELIEKSSEDVRRFQFLEKMYELSKSTLASMQDWDDKTFPLTYVEYEVEES